MPVIRTPFISKKANSSSCFPLDHASYVKLAFDCPEISIVVFSTTSRSLWVAMSLSSMKVDGDVEFRITTTRTASISPS